jgi:hypothetical protein
MKKLVLIAFLCLLFLNKSFAQENTVIVSDLETWSSIKVSKKVWKLNISLEEELRLNRNSSQIDLFFTDLGVSYKINKYVKMGTDYRFYRTLTNSGDFETRHRFSGEVKLNYDIKRFDVSYRLRFQNKDEDFYKSDLSDNNLSNLRNKIKIDYNIKKSKFNPYLSAELFRRLARSDADYFNKYRLTLGTTYTFKNIGSINIFYRFDKELNTTYPKSTYILGVGYSYKIK